MNAWMDPLKDSAMFSASYDVPGAYARTALPVRNSKTPYARRFRATPTPTLTLVLDRSRAYAKTVRGATGRARPDRGGAVAYR